MSFDPRLIAVAEAIYLQHFATAHGSVVSAMRLVEKHPFDPEGPDGEDYLREAAAAINAWTFANAANSGGDQVE